MSEPMEPVNNFAHVWSFIGGFSPTPTHEGPESIGQFDPVTLTLPRTLGASAVDNYLNSDLKVQYVAERSLMCIKLGTSVRHETPDENDILTI
jgi:hypothetical protein